MFNVPGTIAPARETSDKENPILALLMNLNLVVPIAAAILVIIAAIVVICVLKGRNNFSKGSFAKIHVERTGDCNVLLSFMQTKLSTIKLVWLPWNVEICEKSLVTFRLPTANFHLFQDPSTTLVIVLNAVRFVAFLRFNFFLSFFHSLLNFSLSCLNARC